MPRLQILKMSGISLMLTFATSFFSKVLHAQPNKGHVSVNEVNYYYEIHGEGKPLLLLHGGVGSFEMFRPILSQLSKERQVIGVDLHGHGRTALGDRDINMKDMGDDMATLLSELGYKKPVDVMGYSLGGGVALRTAIQHPKSVNRLVVVSSGFTNDAFFPEIQKQQKMMGAGMVDAMRGTQMYESYQEIAPKPDDFPKLLDQMGALMRKSYDWSDEIKSLKLPVMLVYGDSDMFRLEYMINFYKLLGGGQRDAGWKGQYMSKNRLAILPGRTHYNIFKAPELVRTVLPFLNGAWE
ncbi:alpha/beta hydrolase [Fodinibius sp. Rm-B-1B1-1]|uniref:alpha/beta fold hydrolase n=1 Tax=Fodinibius alkaliphilus TaxID=3140241 RepID=UPI003159E1B4